MSTTTAILCAFGVYLLLMIGIGVWCMKKTTGADDYFLGGRGLSGPVAALSAQASDMTSRFHLCAGYRAGMDCYRSWTWNNRKLVNHCKTASCLHHRSK